MRRSPLIVLLVVATLLALLVPVDAHRQGIRNGYERMLYDCSHDWGWESGKPGDRGHELIALDITERDIDGKSMLLVEINMARGLPDSSGLPYRAWETITFQTPRLEVSTRVESTKETSLTFSDGMEPDHIGPLKPGVTQGGGDDKRLLSFDLGYHYDRLQVQDGERLTAFHVQGWYEDLGKRTPGDHMPGGFQNAGDPRQKDIEGCLLAKENDPKKDETHFVADGYTITRSDWSVTATNAEESGADGATGTPAPVADFAFDPVRPSRIDNVTFTDQSRSAGSEIVAWHWDLTDATKASGAEVFHRFSALGKHEVILNITDAAGQSAEVRKTVQVVNLPPTAAFVVPEAPNDAGNPLRLEDDSTDLDGKILFRSWSMGDGTVHETATVEHAYASAGTYAIVLTVTDDNGATHSVQQTVEVVGAPDIAGEAPAGGVPMVLLSGLVLVLLVRRHLSTE